MKVQCQNCSPTQWHATMFLITISEYPTLDYKTASFSNRNYQPTHYLLLTHWQCLPESTNPPSQISYVYENKQYSQLLINIGQQGDALLKSLSILQLYHLLLITTKSVNDTNQNNEHVLCTGVTHILICTLFGFVTMMIDNYRW